MSWHLQKPESHQWSFKNSSEWVILLQGQTIIRLGCDKNGSTKTPVIIKVDWIVALNAWDCCRNNLHFRVLFWPLEPAVWELFGFCWFASVCWIERGHFEFQTFPWLLDEKRSLLAKDILYQFQTQRKNHLGQISTKGEPLCEILKGFSVVSSYSDPAQWKAVFEHFKSRAQLMILILQSNYCIFKIKVSCLIGWDVLLFKDSIFHICQVWYDTALFRPTPKSTKICDKIAGIGQNRPNFWLLDAKKYTGMVGLTIMS